MKMARSCGRLGIPLTTDALTNAPTQTQDPVRGDGADKRGEHDDASDGPGEARTGALVWWLGWMDGAGLTDTKRVCVPITHHTRP